MPASMLIGYEADLLAGLDQRLQPSQELNENDGMGRGLVASLLNELIESLGADHLDLSRQNSPALAGQIDGLTT